MKIAVVALILYAGWEIASPFIDKYVLTKEVENIAQYATINSQERSEKEFYSRIKNKGGLQKLLVGKPVVIEKDDYNKTARVILKYNDSIKIFGFLIKEYEFLIEANAAKVDKKF
ncbi:MAG TPA: hypothetical protein ENN58_00815 [bacterium]|nr:hypothetical protein [bacterium]